MVLDQCQHVADFGVFAGMLDHDDRRLPVGHQADAVGVALLEADLVQELVGLLEIVGRPLGGVLGLEQHRARHDGVVGGLGEPDERHLVELVAVYGERQRPAEADVAVELAPIVVLGVEVGIDRELRA